MYLSAHFLILIEVLNEVRKLPDQKNATTWIYCLDTILGCGEDMPILKVLPHHYGKDVSLCQLHLFIFLSFFLYILHIYFFLYISPYLLLNIH